MADSDDTSLTVSDLTGRFDQAALIGLQRRPHTLGIPLISVIFVGRE
jgi:hypothetical protein